MKALLAASALASLAALAACATALPVETGEYAAGQRLYREHCGSCHRLRNPNEQTREKWARAVRKYGDRAHLAQEDRPAVLDYLQARAKDAPPATPPTPPTPSAPPPATESR